MTVPFRLPVSGTIVEKVAVEGMRVTAGQRLFRVADLSVVWVGRRARTGPVERAGRSNGTRDAPGIPGSTARRPNHLPLPNGRGQTRTAKVRIQFVNRGGRSARHVRRGGSHGRDAEALTVPTDAVLEAGADQLVFVSLGDGRFEPRPVKVGRRSREEIEITSGLKEGEQVATGAAFFLDSESQLRAAVQSYQAPADQVVSAGPAQRIDISFRPQPDPPRTGENTFEVAVRDASGRPSPTPTCRSRYSWPRCRR